MATCDVCGETVSGTEAMSCEDCEETFCRAHYHDHACDPVDAADDPSSTADVTHDRDETTESDTTTSEQPAGEQDVKYCQSCGQELRADAEFCDRCGSDQTAPSLEDEKTSVQTDNDKPSSGGISRRKLIAGGVGGGILGLGAIGLLQGGGDPRFEPAGDVWSNEQREETQNSVTVVTEFELPRGTWATRELTPNVGAIFEYELDSDNPIDVWVMEVVEFQRYRDQEDDWLQLTAFEGTGANITRSGEISAGDFRIVLDNSGLFGSSPEGDASGELMMRVRV